MTWGEGSLFLATRKGVLVLGLPLIPASTPAPTVWAHDSGCAWAAAWLTLRDREFLGQRFDVILTNPPFGTKGANQAPARDDFVVETSNKQLNFLQHVLTLLKPGGRCAIVVPDNVLFADEAGEVFKVLMEDCNVHTVLRCPRGTFAPYTAGTKTNVLSFTKSEPTKRLWVYDARANVPMITKKSRPLTAAHFNDFESCFGSDPDGRGKRVEADSSEGRWRSFTLDEIIERGYKIDSFKWLRDEELDDPDVVLDPAELVTDAIAELQAAVAELHVLRTRPDDTEVTV